MWARKVNCLQRGLAQLLNIHWQVVKKVDCVHYPAMDTIDRQRQSVKSYMQLVES